MSRLTASPFHKPSPFNFPKSIAPLSPPETNTDYVTPAKVPLSRTQTTSNLRDYDFPEGLETRTRKAPSLSYNTSGLRESRERSVQRGLKSFIIVIPPASLLHEHGQLGSTLSSGPAHRLSQGILMPLFPTMYGQLTAIAKEFSFPSTAGLCLYLHYTEAGITLSPRISDDSWPFLWSHTFEMRQPPTPTLPISGRVEFDVDLRQARWYTSWLASSVRDVMDIPRSVSPSLIASKGAYFSHVREDSRMTFVDDHFAEDQGDDASVTPQRRHVPRKLSLVDRYENMSVKSGSKTAAAHDVTLPEAQFAPSRTLSPIPQQEEPKTARNDLQNRVNSWRASATIMPTILAASGQISLEPANLPNTMHLEVQEEGSELNLDDFTWSISSAGPGDSPLQSVSSWDRVQSVHLAARLQGSVCLTPSICTSFGPSDYDMDSYIYAYSSRVPSPDIGQRQLFDCPLTPMTATSWGPASSYPASSLDISRPPSVDLGARAVFSRPTTPVTATSWGPSSCPASPAFGAVEYSRPPSVHLAYRGEFSRPVSPMTATSWGAPSEWPASPMTPFHVRTPDIGERSFDESVAAAIPSLRWKMSWPMYDVTVGKVWDKVWPYCAYKAEVQHCHSTSLSSTKGVQAQPTKQPRDHVLPYAASHAIRDVDQPMKQVWNYVWPYVHYDQAAERQPWQHVWPYLASHANGGEVHPTKQVWNHVWPYVHYDQIIEGQPWHHVWPYVAQRVIHENLTVKLPPIYPALEIYTSVYPWNLDTIYPSVKPIREPESSFYPEFNLYPPVAASVSESFNDSHSLLSVKLPISYPTLDIYPAVYPWSLDTIYPAICKEAETTLSMGKVHRYPESLFGLYPAVHPYSNVSDTESRMAGPPSVVVYPYFDLYPAKDDFYSSSKVPDFLSRPNPGYPHFDLYSTAEKRERMSQYPDFNLYPPVKARPARRLEKSSQYPDFDLYPAIDCAKRNRGISSQYPSFELYPPAVSAPRTLHQARTAQYPDFELYSPVPSLPSIQRERKPSQYPDFDLYPPANVSHGLIKLRTSQYPDFNIYPPISTPSRPSKLRSANISSSNIVGHGYPTLYPLVYPTFYIYPTQPENCISVSQKSYISSRNHHYPIFDIYPAIYPHFDIYPCSQPLSMNEYISPKSTNSRYPVFNLYPSVYPHFDLYPVFPVVDKQSIRPTISYPFSNLYPAVYPYFDLWPAKVPVMAPSRKRRRTHRELRDIVLGDYASTPVNGKQRKSHAALHRDVFGNCEPRTPSGNISPSIDQVTSPVHFQPAIRAQFDHPNGTRPLTKRTSLPPASPSPTASLPPIPLATMPLPSRSHSPVSSTKSILVNRSSRPASTIIEPPFVIKKGSVVPSLGTVEEHKRAGSQPLINRPVSMAAPSSPAASLTRSYSHPSIPARRRDSLVLQRVRAMNSPGEKEAATTMDTISQFPLPPRPFVPPLPAKAGKLDRSKFPFV